MMLFKRLLVGIVLLLVMPVMAQESGTGGARLRVANYVVDAPEVEILLDGETLAALAFQAASQHAEVGMGTHTLTVASADNSALIAPVEVTFEADHDYTVAFIGQLADASAQLLVLDETSLVADVRDETPASYAILVHAISDGPTVDFSLDGEVRMASLAYGQYGVVPVTLEPHDIVVTFSDDADAVLFQNSGETPPADDLLLLTVMAGDYPDNIDVTGAVSRLPDRSVVDFLRTYSDAAGNSFTTLLAAIEATGLTETLVQEGVYTLFAPTDAAFAALPPETLMLLIAYPEAFKAILLGHVVPQIFTTRDLTDVLHLETLGGTQVTVGRDAEGGLVVNESATLLFGGFPVITNGNVIGVDHLLIPAN